MRLITDCLGWTLGGEPSSAAAPAVISASAFGPGRGNAETPGLALLPWRPTPGPAGSWHHSGVAPVSLSREQRPSLSAGRGHASREGAWPSVLGAAVFYCVSAPGCQPGAGPEVPRRPEESDPGGAASPLPAAGSAAEHFVHFVRKHVLKRSPFQVGSLEKSGSRSQTFQGRSALGSCSACIPASDFWGVGGGPPWQRLISGHGEGGSVAPTAPPVASEGALHGRQVM